MNNKCIFPTNNTMPKKPLLYNKLSDILNSFLKKNDTESSIITICVPAISLYNSSNFRDIKFDDDNEYRNWLDYYLRHSIEYKTFIRFLKEHDAYEAYIHDNKFFEKTYIVSLNFNCWLLYRNRMSEKRYYWRLVSEAWDNFRRNIADKNNKRY